MPAIAPRHRVAAKLIVLLVAGVGGGVLYHRSAVASFERYQTITLEEYAAGFDAYRASLYEEQYPLWGHVGMMVLVMAVLFGAYELTAVGLASVLGAVFPRRAPPPEALKVPAIESTSRFHSNLGRVAIGIAVAAAAFAGFALLLAARTYEVPEGTDVFAVVRGRWAWTTSGGGCAGDAHTISFSPDHRQMFIAHAKPFEGTDDVADSVTRYDIREHTRGRIRGAIPGETRLTAAGEPVVWDLVLRGPDRYAWRRSNTSSPFAYSRDIVRCP